MVVLVTLDGILCQHGVTWLGMGIGDRSYWSKGYGTEAMSLILRYAFDELNFHRVQTSVFEYNERSIAMYERAVSDGRASIGSSCCARGGATICTSMASCAGSGQP